MSNQLPQLDENAHEYLAPTPDRIVDQKLVGFMAEWVIPRLQGPRVLELGVGDQIWTPRLVTQFPDVTTVDGSAHLLANMEQVLQGKPWTPVCSYFETYTPSLPFDTVLITYVLEHVDDAGLILRRAFDWVKPGGRLAVMVPHALSLHRRLAVKLGINRFPAELGETDRRMQHKHVFTCYEMEKLIVDAGFRVVEQRGLFTKLLPNLMLTQCSDEQLRAMVMLGLDLPIEYSAAIYFMAEKP